MRYHFVSILLVIILLVPKARLLSFPFRKSAAYKLDIQSAYDREVFDLLKFSWKGTPKRDILVKPKATLLSKLMGSTVYAPLLQNCMLTRGDKSYFKIEKYNKKSKKHIFLVKKSGEELILTRVVTEDIPSMENPDLVVLETI